MSPEPFSGVPRIWRNNEINLRMKAEIHCGKVIFPPRDICPHCGKEAGGTVIYYSPIKPKPESSNLNGQEPV